MNKKAIIKKAIKSCGCGKGGIVKAKIPQLNPQTNQEKQNRTTVSSLNTPQISKAMPTKYPSISQGNFQTKTDRPKVPQQVPKIKKDDLVWRKGDKSKIDDLVWRKEDKSVMKKI